ncbi:uncharacterized protein LOC124256643 [Haliotis rubra]|uniref:uncharacterized protein LOC124256643 n=1 Tax=Haliotis rubra TaxID=36100 RepID=UPI001EE61C7F|nr:uncharacterized protein LOC124256643 [Haliotis rubra]
MESLRQLLVIAVLVAFPHVTSEQISPTPIIGSTLAPVTMFQTDYDRDNFIMNLNADVLGIKSMLTKVYDQVVNIPVHPSGPGTNPVAFVAFNVRLTQNLSGLGRGQIIRFDDVVLNKGNGYDARLGVFRCPQPGTYQLSISIGSYGGIQLEIVNNGVQIGRVFSSKSRFGRSVEDEESEEVEDDFYNGIDKRYISTTPPGLGLPSTKIPASGNGYVQPGSEATPSSAQAIVDLKFGDEVWVRHASDNPHDILFGNGMSTFSGHLLNPIK